MMPKLPEISSHGLLYAPSDVRRAAEQYALAYGRAVAEACAAICKAVAERGHHNWSEKMVAEECARVADDFDSFDGSEGSRTARRIAGEIRRRFKGR
jgi:hypothetical protein